MDAASAGPGLEPLDRPFPAKRSRGRPRLAAGAGLLHEGAAREQAPASSAPALPARAAERLRAIIVCGGLAPGAAIREAELCGALGLSRTLLREALTLRAAEGKVELRANRSARVAPLRAEETCALFEALAGIERVGAELAARRAGPAERDELRRHQDRIERRPGTDEIAERFALNQRIHQGIVAASGNAVLAAVHATLSARAERARRYALAASDARWPESEQEHRDILAALDAHDPAQAGLAMERHLRRSGEVVHAALQAGAPACAS